MRAKWLMVPLHYTDFACILQGVLEHPVPFCLQVLSHLEARICGPLVDTQEIWQDSVYETLH